MQDVIIIGGSFAGLTAAMQLGRARRKVTVLDTGATCGRIEIEHAAATTAGDTAWFAIRPEKVTLSHDAPADTSTNCVAGEVWDIGYLGNLSTYHVKLDSGKMVTATQANMARLIERPITWEDRVYLTWAPDAAVVLRD